jgi:hypothetical protein
MSPAPRATDAATTKRRWRFVAALLGAMGVGAAASAAVFLLGRAAPVVERAPAPAARSVERPPATEAIQAAPARPGASRSRGRTDWIFFFTPGDRLVHMRDDTALGTIVRTVPRHEFADGTAGPAYVLQLPDGAGLQFVDADELERGGRLR